MFSLVQLLAGIALILFGVRLLREGLERICGPRMEDLVRQLTQRPGRAFLAGLGVGATVPSSTSVSLLIVQAIRTSCITAVQSLPLMLGADIGITALVLFSSLHVEKAAPVLLVLGIALYQFARSKKGYSTGQMLLGLGIVLLGVSQIEIIGAAIALHPDITSLFAIAEHFPAALTILAGCVAIALQSSTATILVLGSFGATGSLTLGLALYVVIGANLGIAATRLMIGWTLTEGRRLAVAGLLGRLIVAALMAAWGGLLLQGLARVDISGLPLGYSLKVALLHVSFNVLCAAIGIPLGAVLVGVASWILPAPPAAKGLFGPRYIAGASAQEPSLALGQSLREILHAAEIVREMLADLWRALELRDEDMARAVSQRDDQVDLLDKEVKRFLTQLANRDLETEVALEQMRQLRFLNEIEAIGDIVDKNLSELVLKKLEFGMEFPEPAWSDLRTFFSKVQENMLIAEVAFQTRDPKLAAQLLRHKEWLNQYHRQLTDQQLTRLTHRQGETPEISAVELDLLVNLKRINSCTSHVAYALLDPAALPQPANIPMA
jgi:phosphate:Na+ symporter